MNVWLTALHQKQRNGVRKDQESSITEQQRNLEFTRGNGEIMGIAAHTLPKRSHNIGKLLLQEDKSITSNVNNFFTTTDSRSIRKRYNTMRNVNLERLKRSGM